jgi:hypothetical protein
LRISVKFFEKYGFPACFLRPGRAQHTRILYNMIENGSLYDNFVWYRIIYPNILNYCIRWRKTDNEYCTIWYNDAI